MPASFIALASAATSSAVPSTITSGGSSTGANCTFISVPSAFCTSKNLAPDMHGRSTREISDGFAV